jgi:hypothetical protein
MKFTTHQSQIRTIKHDDPRFRITDKFTTAPRAGFEISMSCPYAYREVIEQCVSNGWLRPVAHMTERELLISGLAND